MGQNNYNEFLILFGLSSSTLWGGVCGWREAKQHMFGGIFEGHI